MNAPAPSGPFLIQLTILSIARAIYTREMELRPRWKIRWLVIVLLTLPTLVWFAYSLLHPGGKKNGEKLYRLVEVPVHAEQTSPWVMQESGTKAGLRGIYSVDGKIAWASGTGGTVLKTVDGGEHWQKCAVPGQDGETLDFRGVQAWDAQTAIVMASGPGKKSRLYKTADGCKSWTLKFQNEDKDGFWDALRLWTPTDGFLAGDPVNGNFFLSESSTGLGEAVNGGFIDNALYGVFAKKGEAAFAASNSCIALGPLQEQVGTSRDVWLATGGPAGSRVIHYQHFNGGEPERVSVSSSDAAMFPRTSSGGIFSIQMRDEKHGIAVGGDYTKPNENTGTAAYSPDGGLHWTVATKPPHGYRSSVAWSEARRTWIAAGTNGSDVSRDDGKTWQPLDYGNWNALSLPFVVGPNGGIARLSTSTSAGIK